MYTYNTKGELLEGYESRNVTDLNISSENYNNSPRFSSENCSENSGERKSRHISGEDGDSTKKPMLWTAVGVGGLVLILVIIGFYFFYGKSKTNSMSSSDSTASSGKISSVGFSMEKPDDMEWGFKFY